MLTIFTGRIDDHNDHAVSGAAQLGGRLAERSLAVAIIVWSTITVFGTVATFAQCANSPLGCVGGAVGLASVAAAVIGVVAAAGALRRGRGVGRAWICVAATVVLTLVMAGFGAASS